MLEPWTRRRAVSEARREAFGEPLEEWFVETEPIGGREGLEKPRGSDGGPPNGHFETLFLLLTNPQLQTEWHSGVGTRSTKSGGAGHWAIRARPPMYVICKSRHSS